MTLMDGDPCTLDSPFSYPYSNKRKDHWYGAAAPTNPQNGMIWVKNDGTCQFYHNGAWYPLLTAPGFLEGMIIAWIAGYFTDGVNGGYTRVLGAANTVVAVNALLNAQGWYVCDGAVLNLGASTIFNGAGRYLPNLTDDRFIMGDTLAGGIGGSSTMAHTHAAGTYAAANESAHTHSDGTYVVSAHYHTAPASIHDTTRPATTIAWGTDSNTVAFYSSIGVSYGTALGWARTKTATADVTGTSGAGSAHGHTVSGNSGAASVTENRPKFLGCFYIMYVLA